MVDKEKVDVKEASMVEVTTQTALAYKLEDEKIVDEKELLLKIYNDLQVIKRSLI